MAVGFMAGSIISKMVMDTRSWSNSVKVVKKDQDTMAGKAAKLAPKFRSIGRGMTLAGAGIVAGLAVGIKAFKSFDLAMTESLAIMGDVSKELREGMKNAALEMSGRSKFAAFELAEAYFFLASAGIDAAGAIKALPVVTKFAQAGALGLATATDLLTDAQSALGLSSKNAVKNQMGMVLVSDVLVKANTLANAKVQEFSEALTNRAAPAMRAYGVEIEEGVAVLAAFADQGVKGRRAGMQYAIVLSRMQTAAMDNSEAFREAGIAVFDASGNLNNMGVVIGQIEKRFQGMSAEQKKAELATLGFTEETQVALLTLVGTSEKIKEYEKNLRSAGGVTQEVSDKQLKSLSSQMLIAKNNIVNAGIALGEQLAPAVISISKWIAKVAGGVTTWAKENKTLFGILVKVAAVLGGLLSILGPIVIKIPRLVQGFKLLGIAAKGAMGPIGILITGLGFLASRAVIATKDFKKFSNILEAEAESQGKKIGWLKKTWSSLDAVFQKHISGIDKVKLAQQAYAKHLDKVNRKNIDWKKTMSGLVGFGKKVADAYNQSLGPAVKNLGDDFDALGDSAETAGTKIKGIELGVWEQKLIDLSSSVKEGTISWAEYIFQMKELKREQKVIAQGFDEMDFAIEDTNIQISGMGMTVEQMVIDSMTALEGLSTTIGGLPKDFVEAGRKTKVEVKSWWTDITDGMKTKWGIMWGDFLKGPISLKSFSEAFKKFTDNLLSQFADMVGNMIAKWTVGFLQSMVSKTGPALADVVGGMKDVTKGATNLIKGFNPGGMIATGIGAAVGTFLGGLLGPKGPSARSTDLIKDNTWNTNQNVINLHDAMVAQLHEIKVSGWQSAGNLEEIKLSMWNANDKLGAIRKAIDRPLSSGQTGAANVTVGTSGLVNSFTEALQKIEQQKMEKDKTKQLHIEKIENVVNLNGTIISDRDYARRQMLPEILHALKQRTEKKRLQEILGIA